MMHWCNGGHGGVCKGHLGHARWQGDPGQAGFLQEDLIHRLLQPIGINPVADGEPGLRVEVDEQDALPLLGKGGPKCPDGGGFAHAAFLIRNRVDGAHTKSQ